MYKSRKKSAALCAGIFLALGMWMILSVCCLAAEMNHDEKQATDGRSGVKWRSRNLSAWGSFEDTFDYVDENGIRRGFHMNLCRLCRLYRMEV